MRHLNRREWLKLMMQGSFGFAALSSFQLAMLPKALAAQSTSSTDYKALVCVFLFGGNDSLNMLLPLSGASLSGYQQARQSLAVADAIALQPNTAVADGLGLHPALAALEPLFKQQQLALLGGVGALLQPTSKAAVQQGNAFLPKNLFSHNDQQSTWMRGQEPQILDRGWGARMLELLLDTPDFASNFSLSGSNLWQRGQLLQPFGISAKGVPELAALAGTSRRATVMSNLQTSLFANQSQPLMQQFAQSHSAAQSRSLIVADALKQAPQLNTVFDPANSLALQLKMVANLISVQSVLGVNRQVFFVGLGGFDTHDDQNTVHPALLSKLAGALSSFSAAMTELGVADQVTSFTMSDFGRTLSSNGDGTDHGWAGNQFILGGAVAGGELYGQMVEQRIGSAQDIGGGRIIPTVANAQYFAALARWFGVNDSQLPLLFPEIAQFDAKALQLFR